MAVTITCRNPLDLLNKIKSSIQDGKIQTWAVDTDGDFTHSAEQWRSQAWFRPVVEHDNLVFHILGTRTKAMTKAVYGIYHGRLIEMLLTHFDLEFISAHASALPSGRDWVRPPG